MLETQCVERNVPCPAIRLDEGTGFDHIAKEAGQVTSGHIGDMTQANSSAPLLFYLYRNGHDSLSDCVSAPHTSLRSPKIAFIDLHRTNQSASASTHHGPSEFVEPCPSGNVTAQAEDSLQSESIRAVFLTCQFPDGIEPQTKGLPGSLKNCSRGHRDLSATQRAEEQVPSRMPRCGAASPATWADKLFAPSQLFHIALASLFIGEESKKIPPRCEDNRRPLWAKWLSGLPCHEDIIRWSKVSTPFRKLRKGSRGKLLNDCWRREG